MPRIHIQNQFNTTYEEWGRKLTECYPEIYFEVFREIRLCKAYHEGNVVGEFNFKEGRGYVDTPDNAKAVDNREFEQYQEIPIDKYVSKK